MLEIQCLFESPNGKRFFAVSTSPLPSVTRESDEPQRRTPCGEPSSSSSSERVPGTRRTQVAGAPDPLAAAARPTPAEVVERRGRRPDGVGRLRPGGGRGGGLAAGGGLLGLRGHLDDGEPVFSSRKVDLAWVRRGTRIPTTMITTTSMVDRTTSTIIEYVDGDG